MKKLLLFVFLLSASAVLAGCGEKKEAAMPVNPDVQANTEYSAQDAGMQTKTASSEEEQMQDIQDANQNAAESKSE